MDDMPSILPNIKHFPTGAVDPTLSYGKPVDATLYCGMIGSLMYLTSSRPDLIYAVCLCARLLLNAATTQYSKTKHIDVAKPFIKEQLKYDQHAYFGTSNWGPKRQSFYEYASNLTSSKDVYSRRRIIVVTRLMIMKKYDYGHQEEIEVHRDDQKLYTFKEGDFKRLHLQDIEDMLLLLTYYHSKGVEDLQLGVKSYQKKLNLTKPNTYRPSLRNKTAYTSHSDPHGIIYVDQFKRKRLMRTDELHKFSDGTLNDVRTTLYDIVVGIRIEYLPMRKRSNLDKKMARVMV
ncbi:hypothetical protein Tco_0158407 [Tanacetum coccineum]